jgi:hypothetical protein
MYIIIDLDNIISDDSWRIDTIDWTKEDELARYNHYNLLSGFDVAGNEWLFQNNDHEVVVLSSRPEFYAPITVQWLKSIDIDPIFLIMRENGDNSTPSQLKKKQLQSFYNVMRSKAEDVIGAYDSDPETVEMYASSGLNAHLLYIHGRSNKAFDLPLHECRR